MAQEKVKTPPEQGAGAKASRQTGRQKRVILTVFGVLVALILLLWAVSLILERIAVPSGEDETKAPVRYRFWEADWSENIFENPEYLELDRTVYYSPYGVGVGETVSVDETTVDGYGEVPALLYQLIWAIIRGDADAYNSFFTRSYLEENGPHDPFTMQMLYDIKIAFYQAGSADGTTATPIYRLEYKICRNNGTFRSDMGSDVAKEQYFVFVKTDLGYRVNEIITPGAF